jgi:hypothetical protein
LVPDIGSFDLTMTLLRSYSRAANASDWMRLLHHAASKTTADLCGSAVVPQSTKPEMAALKRNNIGRQWRRARAPRGMAMRDTGR